MCHTGARRSCKSAGDSPGLNVCGASALGGGAESGIARGLLSDSWLLQTGRGEILLWRGREGKRRGRGRSITQCNSCKEGKESHVRNIQTPPPGLGCKGVLGKFAERQGLV